MQDPRISDLSKPLSAHLEDWKGIAGQAATEFADRASKTVDQASEVVTDALARAKYRSIVVAQTARYRVRRTTHEYPLQVIGGVAATAFLAGILLRVWRANRHA